MKKKSKGKSITFNKDRVVPSKKILGIAFALFAVLVFISISDYNIGQFKANNTNLTDINLIGDFGAYISNYGFNFFGGALWLVPVILILLSYNFFREQKRGIRLKQFVLAFISLISLSAIFSILQGMNKINFLREVMEQKLFLGDLGGHLGRFFKITVLSPFGPLGSLLISSFFFVGSLYLILGDNLIILSQFLARKIKYTIELLLSFLKKFFLNLGKTLRHLGCGLAKLCNGFVKLLSLKNFIKSENVKPSLKNLNEEFLDNSTPVVKEEIISPIEEEGAHKIELDHGSIPEKKKPKLDLSLFKINKGEKTEKAVAIIPERRGDYVFPSIDLLKNAPQVSGDKHEDHAETMEALVQTLEEFGVNVTPGEIFTGPVITRYEVTPAPGVRVEKIVSLDKNLALGLKALSVRILAPVPGKGTVGIEVPNRISQAVCMRDIIESKSWAEANAEIPIVLGKDVTGKPIVGDLTKMPHVLIAGSTGSGKTVCINAIIASLLYHSGPEDIRFIMVDPKVVEMQLFNALPHMLIPVVTEPKKVPGALKWLMAEMDRRYQIFAKTKVRNIAGFNAKISKDKAEQERAKELEAEMTAEERAASSQVEVPRDEDAFEVPKKKLPYIVCIIDELADLMMVAPADVETGISRIAQLARAAGIHLILATQRPSVNVITGVIKANLPSRISFKVSSKIDSRTILDGPGAESLIGKGDMLFIPPGDSSLIRVQGAFVSDEEINSMVDFLKQKNEPPVFAEAVQKQIDSSDDEGASIFEGGEDDDEMLNQALEVLKASKRASTSMLQRRLRIGYNRAARIMEELEEKGIVGPENGSSPREILVDLDSI